MWSVVGSGFGSLFFVEGYLSRRPAAKILMLERGTFNSHAWQLEQNKNSPIVPSSTFSTDEAKKAWNFTIGVGGGTNCWYAQTPRFHPSDFRMRSNYGVAQDWPLDYDELEPYYVAAETKMSVAGSPEMGEILPRSAPFPQPPHKQTCRRRDHAQGSAAVSCSDRHGARQCRRCRTPAVLCLGAMQVCVR